MPVPSRHPESVIFTSSGTEGNNAILKSFGQDVVGMTLVTTAVEHPSILRPAEVFKRAGGRLVVLPVSQDGLVDPGAVGHAVREARGSVILSVQWANSETGVVQPMRELAAEVKQIRSDVLIHSDVAQAVGRFPIDLDTVSVDVVTFSSHKIHGPQGVGALVFRDPDERRVAPFILGGGQERGLRSGSNNVAGAAGFGLAASVRSSEFAAATARLAEMRDFFENGIVSQIRQARVNGGQTLRVPNTTSIRFPGIEAVEMLARLDAKGIACSIGSACSSAKPEPSHVLTAMGISQSDAFSSVRFSFSILNTMDEAEQAARIVADTFLEIT